MQACVHDRYAKRIDRFFAQHPELAQNYVTHPYFEVRAIASKYLDVFHLSRMRNDPDETVRSMVVLRLPQRQLLEMRNDPDREVRIRVASKLLPHDLEPMMHDEDGNVRAMHGAAHVQAAGQRDAQFGGKVFVREAVVDRIDDNLLPAMINDPEGGVRLAVAKRLSEQQLVLLRHDTDWRVRYEVASRITTDYLRELAQDEDTMVQEMALMRLMENAMGKSESERREHGKN